MSLLFEGLKHVQLPIPEFDSPSFKQVDDFVNVVEKAKQNNEVNNFFSYCRIVSQKCRYHLVQKLKYLCIIPVM